MYVYIRMYVCIYVCMYACMNVYIRMYVHIIRMYVCMYVCMYVYAGREWGRAGRCVMTYPDMIGLDMRASPSETIRAVVNGQEEVNM